MTWNVYILYQTGKLAQLLLEFKTYRLEILGVSKMRWMGRDRIVSDGKTALYSRKDYWHICSVGLVLSKEAVLALTGWKPVSE